MPSDSRGARESNITLPAAKFSELVNRASCAVGYLGAYARLEDKPLAQQTADELSAAIKDAINTSGLE